MSVPTWNRKDSKMKYLSLTYDLSFEVINYLNKLPTKYRTGIGDELERELIHAMHNGKLANSIYGIGSKADMHERRYHLLQMKASIDTIATFTTILIEINRKHDGSDINKIKKLLGYEERIGDKCNEINKCIAGLISSDVTRWNGMHPSDKVNKRWRMKSVVGDVRFNSDTMQVHHTPNNDNIDDDYKEIIPTDELPDYWEIVNEMGATSES